MRIFITAALLFLAMLCLPLSATAEPSINGYTGLILAPTAHVATENYVELGLNTRELEDFDNVTWLANFGANEGLEVGFAHIEFGDSSDQETVISGKYQVRQESGEKPAIAFGVFDITDGISSTAYIALSKSYGKDVGKIRGKDTRLLGLHGGFGGGIIDGLFVGGEAQIGKEVTAQLEWVSDGFSAGAILRPCETLSVGAAWLDFDDLAITTSPAFQLK
jgi:hypothetical protein